MAWLEKEIIEKGKASILSAAGEGTGDNSPQGAFMRDIMKAFARFELAMIKQRTSAAVKVKMERKRQAGEKTGGHVPFGYDAATVDGVKVLAENAREQAAIRLMTALREAGATLRETAEYLGYAGIKPKGGGEWSAKVVRGILLREGKAGEGKAGTAAQAGTAA